MASVVRRPCCQFRVLPILRWIASPWYIALQYWHGTRYSHLVGLARDWHHSDGCRAPPAHRVLLVLFRRGRRRHRVLRFARPGALFSCARTRLYWDLTILCRPAPQTS